ncbi:ABC transporter ATP-binding protein [Rhizobium halophytocola]|uniref:Spermidine/putrescine transport system ATP-binding protein n=1 Tax=Rhizobium halophytocola TaxID=735519 RepID=A0ABS4DU83_9HYPH|nr:ABC transporter ATP-binding protein [Rhizobium halophytocola]MBP1849230.1 putative spermidine/putrescine transport system ATP-binding protein [Rhizobium halophytocola]
MAPAVTFRAVSRLFGAVRAVDNVDLEIAEGEFFAMLGPSGSGKTTCLRLIAGFEQPSRGAIEIFGVNANAVPPWKRQVNTVFQDYALFPHMTILDNVAYGLMVKGIDKQTRYGLSEEVLDQVKLGGYGPRKTGQLSGGQRQRVALARALVNKPSVLLLDEPLGALDLKLREAMQEELKALQKRLGITFVFVTHDQSEALSMADRVAVFNEGRIVQAGTPEEIYRNPRTRFVADFVGSSNLLPPGITETLTGKRVWSSLRPEMVELSAAPGRLSLSGRLSTSSFLGAVRRISVDLGGETVHAHLPASQTLPDEGSTVTLAFDRAALNLLEDAP